jgi:DNA primase
MQNTYVDFRAVKEAVSIRMALDHYGVNWLRKNGEELRGRCPIHKGEGTDTFHASVAKNIFNCFSCKARGNVLDFVAAMEQCTVRDGAIKLAEWFSIPSSSERPKPAAPKKATPASNRGEGTVKNTPLSFQLKDVDAKHPYLAERGIRLETAEQFGIGYFAGKGSMSGRIVIPIHDEFGKLIAYAGRSIDNSEPRYKLPAGFHKSLVLYNLHRAMTRNSVRVSTVVLVEGFFDCIKVHEAGYPCVALMGCSLSNEQEEVLCRRFTGAVLLFDGDEAGKAATDECLARLGRKLWVKAISVPAGRQPDQLSTEELQALLVSEC